LADVLRHIPRSANPDLLVGFETSDDAGVFRLSDGLALVQTVDFFTPIVDDPYAYGQIAAANALSDIYAMGARPLTVLNIACFSPAAAPPEVWAEVIRGAYDKTVESGAVIMGGHSVEDPEPKFGMSVTGVVDPERMFVNTEAKPGDEICLSKPLGTGIITTAAKYDGCSDEEMRSAISAMSTLNKAAAEAAKLLGVRCATDITGFGLAGHLYNIARGSEVTIEVDSNALPMLPGVERLIRSGHVTGGGAKNAAFVGESLVFAPDVKDWVRQLVVDPQTSGGLAVCVPPSAKASVEGWTRIGRVAEGSALVRFV
jgi:selenide, water dikinase